MCADEESPAFGLGFCAQGCRAASCQSRYTHCMSDVHAEHAPEAPMGQSFAVYDPEYHAN